MKIRLAADLQTDSIVDGVGIRTVIWTQGCSHNCPFCHNPGTHDFNSGELVPIQEVIARIENLSGQDGITFSGGDPMFQPGPCYEIAKKVHEFGMNVWTYTGFTYEELLKSKNKDILNFLSEIDVLIDGKFDINKKSLDLSYRGSSNQRIIDVQESLKQNKVIILDLDEHKKQKKELLYI